MLFRNELQVVRIGCGLLLTLICCRMSLAQTWDGGGADNNFNTANNWNPNAVPANNGTANLIFDGTTRLTPNVNVNFDVNSLAFASSAGAFQIQGTQLTIRSGGITNNRNNPTGVTIVPTTVVLGASQTWNAAASQLIVTATTLNTNGNLLTIDGTFNSMFSGSIIGGGSLTKNGTGLLAFTGMGKDLGGSLTMNDGTTNILAGGGLTVGNNFAANGLVIDGTGSVSVNSGADLNILGSSGTLGINGGIFSADGIGTTVTSSGTGSTFWAQAGATATVNLSHGATATFSGGIALGDSGFSSVANVNVKSGAHFNVGSLSLGCVANSPMSGAPTSTLTITDPNSSVTLNPGANLTLGDIFGTSETINVNDGASLTVGTGGATTMFSGSTLNINGGNVDLKSLTYNGGSVNFTAGLLSYGGNLTVGSGGLLGTSLTLDVNKRLTLSGTTTIDAGRVLTLSGGTLNTGSLAANGTFLWNSGTLGITGAGGLTIGAGGPLGSVFSLADGKTLNVTNTTFINSGALLNVENGATLFTSGITNNGELALGGSAAVANGNFYSNLGLIRGDGRINSIVDNAAAGEIRAESGKRLLFTANNTPNSGRINLLGGIAEFTQPVVNGAGGLILGNGTLKAGGIGLTNNGQMIFSNGTTYLFGDVSNNTASATKGITISGNSGVTFWDDVTHTAPSLFKVQAGSSATFFGTFGGTGGVTGGGDVYMEADLTPGSSPASVSFDTNVHLGTAATTKIELGGTTPGTQFDQIHVAQTLSLGGTLQVSLINGFTPALSNTFDILDFGTLTGNFSSIQLPALPGSLTWSTSQLLTTGVLSVVGSNLLPGDFNRDGHVNAADIPAMLAALSDLNAYKAANSLSDASLLSIGDIDGSGALNNADAQALLTLLKNGGGSVMIVREPASVLLLLLALPGLAFPAAFRRCE